MWYPNNNVDNTKKNLRDVIFSSVNQAEFYWFRLPRLLEYKLGYRKNLCRPLVISLRIISTQRWKTKISSLPINCFWGVKWEYACKAQREMFRMISKIQNRYRLWSAGCTFRLTHSLIGVWYWVALPEL